MTALKIADIREWLIENRSEYQRLKEQEYPPFGNEMYWMYDQLFDFINYYKYKQHCDKALAELNTDDFIQLTLWTKEYETLGSQDLLMFEVNYIDWEDYASSDQIKIHKGLYTDKKPFLSILCFCKVFQHLFWHNCIHEKEPTNSEKAEIISELQNILKTYYIDNRNK